MSEKPMTELLRKSGIIDKHIAEFQKWRIIDENGFFAETKSAEDMVGDLVAEISELLEKEPVMRQTMVTPIIAKKPPERWYIEEAAGVFYAMEDEMGRLLVPSDVIVVRGDRLHRSKDAGQVYLVMEVEKIYENDVVYMLMLTIEKE